MTNSEKLALITAMTDETDEDVISAFLAMAGEAIYHYVDPYKTSEMEIVLAECGGAHARLAAYFINKRGADGETSHSENGISRSYESGDIPPSILRELTPKVGVVK